MGSAPKVGIITSLFGHPVQLEMQIKMIYIGLTTYIEI